MATEVLQDWDCTALTIEAPLVTVRRYCVSAVDIDTLVRRQVERAVRLAQTPAKKGQSPPTVNPVDAVQAILVTLNASDASKDVLAFYVERELVPWLDAMAQHYGTLSGYAEQAERLRALLPVRRFAREEQG